MDKVVRGFLALAFFLMSTGPATAQPVADHLRCYKVKDPQAKATYTATTGSVRAASVGRAL
jgi:hypothetical protein